MNADTRITWNLVQLWEKCPQSVLWGAGWDGVDVGSGPGEPKAKPPAKLQPPLRRKERLLSEWFQRLLYRIYDEGYIRDAKLLRGNLEIWSRRYFAKEAEAYNLTEVVEDLNHLADLNIARFLQAMRTHRLLSGRVETSRVTAAFPNKWMSISAKVPLYIHRTTGPLLLDFGFARKAQEFDPDPTRWLALCVAKGDAIPPDKITLGVFWIQSKTSDAPRDITWLDTDPENLEGLLQRAIYAREQLRYQRFEATPSPTVCGPCLFEAVCDPRLGQKRKKKPRKVKASPIPDGFIDFS